MFEPLQILYLKPNDCGKQSCFNIQFSYENRDLNMKMSVGISKGAENGQVNLGYLVVVKWVASVLEGYCWSRSTYLKAVLRQEVGFFDLKVKTINTIKYLLLDESIDKKLTKADS
ncbi:ABC transporter type 1, transmembrane domain-containing protein [Artemisia annua]|uniref:ABC transporter type 1, transmembrane domain-containing protein n=1 Tax=Artemisia annua TaxID=35608 RepID=A0A2U1L0U1_ARTAN|nr:ABC transporter type 1, transmembrane domain-containing protein [Artemisia annua]